MNNGKEDIAQGMVVKYREILILYHVQAREYTICSMMKDCLLRARLSENIIIENRDDMINHPWDYNPELIISFLPRDDFFTTVYTILKLAYKCTVIAIPNEGFSPTDDEDMHNTIGTNDQPAKLVDYYLFWGEGFGNAAAEALLKYNKVVSRDRVKVFGYLPYEKELMEKYLPKSEIFATIEGKKSHYDKTIMFATGGFGLRRTMQNLVEESTVDPNDESSVRFWTERLKVTETFYDRYVNLIYDTAQKHPDNLVLVKLHPTELGSWNKPGRETRYTRLRSLDNILFIDQPIQIGSLWKYADIYVHYGSTSALESYINRVPTIGLLNEKSAIDGYTAQNEPFGDLIIDITERDKFFDAIERGVVFRRNAKTEEALAFYMNYHFDEEYRPSTKLISYIREAEESMLLDARDPLVKKRTRGKRGINFYLLYVREYLRAIKRHDKVRASLIKRFLKSYTVAAMVKSI